MRIATAIAAAALLVACGGSSGTDGGPQFIGAGSTGGTGASFAGAYAFQPSSVDLQCSGQPDAGCDGTSVFLTFKDDALCRDDSTSAAGQKLSVSIVNHGQISAGSTFSTTIGTQNSYVATAAMFIVPDAGPLEPVQGNISIATFDVHAPSVSGSLDLFFDLFDGGVGHFSGQFDTTKPGCAGGPSTTIEEFSSTGSGGTGTGAGRLDGGLAFMPSYVKADCTFCDGSDIRVDVMNTQECAGDTAPANRAVLLEVSKIDSTQIADGTYYGDDAGYPLEVSVTYFDEDGGLTELNDAIVKFDAMSAVSPTFAVGSFSGTVPLPDGGSSMLSGTFDTTGAGCQL